MKTEAKKFRRCRWMLKSKGWADCGRKATDTMSHGSLLYCSEHAEKVRQLGFATERLKP